jgi:hypothetical protein
MFVCWAINASGHILRERLPEAPLAAYSTRDVMVIVRRREQWPGMRNARITGNQSGSDVFVELPVAATAFTVRPTTGQLELAHTGLTSTDVVALAINSTDARVFCRNLFSDGDGEGMFRPTDNGDNLDGTKWRLYGIQCERRSNQLCRLHLCRRGWWSFSINK